jgi:beta-lactamase regulating signal transducer with metallopeptidase domain
MSEGWVLYLGSLAMRSLGIAALAAVVTFRMRTAALRHGIWVAVLLMTLLMPATDVTLPAANVSVSYAPVQSVLAAAAVKKVRPPASLLTNRSAGIPVRTPLPNASQLALISYLLVVGALLLRFGKACFTLFKTRRSSKVISVPALDQVAAAQEFHAKFPNVFESPLARVPLTAGFIRPWILLPVDWKEWPEWKLKAVFSHELTHIRRRDWLVAMLSTFSTCVFWFNPLCWWLERHLSALAEQAADEATVLFTGDAPQYAEMLLTFAAAAESGNRLQVGVVPMAARRIRARIEKVLSIRRIDKGFLKGTAWILIFGLSAPVLYAASAAHISREEIPAPVVRSIHYIPPVAQTVTAPRAEPSSAPAERATEPLAIEPENTAEIERSVQATNDAINQQLIESLRERLNSLEKHNAALAVTFRPEYPLRKLIESQIREVRAALNSHFSEIPSASPGEFVKPESANTLVLGGFVQDRTLFFRSSERTYSYGCADCTFYAGASGVGGTDNGQPGVLIHLTPDTREVQITCHAARCHVLVYQGTVAELKMNDSAVIPATSPAVIRFFESQ